MSRRGARHILVGVSGNRQQFAVEGEAADWQPLGAVARGLKTDGAVFDTAKRCVYERCTAMCARNVPNPKHLPHLGGGGDFG